MRGVGRINRQAVHDRCNGRCGYCGRMITVKEMQVDHMKPFCFGGTNDLSNLMPACGVCNHYKGARTVEEFRQLLEGLHLRVAKVYIHKVASAYGMAELRQFDSKFYFEKLNHP